MPPKYTFTYFDLKARGEITRYLFAVAGVEYKENTVRPGRSPADPSKEWLELKPKTMWGSLPFLEVDGKVLAQTHAIERFLAREFGLAGKTSFEQGQVDMFATVTDDMSKPTFVWLFQEKDETKKEELKKAFCTDTLPKFLTVFEKQLTTNESGFLVGKGLTLADLCVAGFNEWCTSCLGPEKTTDVYTAFPKVTQLIKRVRETPKLAKYLKERKPTML